MNTARGGLAEYRARTTKVVAGLLVFGALSNGVMRLATSNLDGLDLIVGVLWLSAALVFTAANVLLRRGRPDPAGALLLCGVVIAFCNASLFEHPYASFVALIASGPLMRLVSLASGVLARSRLWLLPLTPLIGLLLFARHRFDPFPGFTSTAELVVTLSVAGFAALIILYFMDTMFATLLGSLEKSERSRDELRRANEALEAARDAALASSRAKSSFLQTMSHELRTPLNAIIGFTEYLIEDQDPRSRLGDSIEDLRKVHGAGKHLHEIIGDILALSRIESGRVDIHTEPVAVRVLLGEVEASLSAEAERNGNKLIVDIAPDCGIAYTDYTKVRQILLNLVGNACKFTHDGTVTVTAKAAKSPDGDDEHGIELAVTDTGIGIEPDDITRLFEPFTQADQTATRQYEGTGLGLTIARHFCEMLGGRVDVTSTPGEGSRFAVWLPTNGTGVMEAVQEHAVPSLLAAQSVSKPRAEELGTIRDPNAPVVLVVDDDPQVRRLMRRLLEPSGFTVHNASNGQRALELARALSPNVITLDVVMDGMDGWEVLGALKSDPELAEIPVVMVSVVADRNIGFSLGAADYLVKPFERARLLRVLNRYRFVGGPPRVLLVDGEPTARVLTRRELEKDGWLVEEADNGDAALERLDAFDPEVVLLDLTISTRGVDGMSVIERLRARETTRDLPIVAFAARELEADERAGLRDRVQRIVESATPGNASSVDSLLDAVRGLALEQRRLKQVG